MKQPAKLVATRSAQFGIPFPPEVGCNLVPSDPGEAQLEAYRQVMGQDPPEHPKGTEAYDQFRFPKKWLASATGMENNVKD